MKETVKSVSIGCILVGLLTLICYRTQVDLASALPLYMLLVIVQAASADFRSAVLVLVISAGCLDFFFTEPRFSFYVRNSLNAVTLLGFVATGVITARLVHWQKKDAKASKLHRDRLDRLYRLSQQLLTLEPEKAMSEGFLGPFHELFGVTAIAAFDAETAQLHMIGAPEKDLASRTREAFIGGHDIVDPKSRLVVRCLRIGAREKMTGAIGFSGLQGSEESTGALAALAAALVQRAKAFRDASTSAAAAQAEVYRSAILDALAHEFKTPLATILAAAGGIREAGPLSSEQSEMVETVEGESLRLENLTSRLLRTARLDREEIKPRMESVDLRPLVTQIVEQFTDRSPDRRIIFVAGADQVEVAADPELLRIALSQLVENACKYSLAGSTIVIELGRHDSTAAIRVSNDGSAIPHKERDRIFERFYRGTDARQSTSGSGLGLYIARKIAVAHGGALDLEVQDRRDGRITFCLRLPVKKEESSHVLTR